MKLKDYFQKKGIKRYSPWATQNGICPSTICRALKGKNISILNMLRIQKATRNAVKIQDFI